MAYLGIDAGTTFIKSSLLDVDAVCLRDACRVAFPEPLRGQPPLYREFDPHAIVEIVRRLIARAGPVDGILFCGQMHGLALANQRGEPLANYIGWSDQRAADSFNEMAPLLTAAERAETGNELRASLPVTFLFHMARHGQLPEGAIPCSLADFVVANLCGTAPVAEPTSAAALGAFDVANARWHATVIEKLGLARLNWPAVRPAGHIAGELEGLPCYAAVGDHQCALAGVRIEEGELSINISTGSQVSALASRFETGGYQTRPYFGGRFLKTVTHIPAGRALNSLVGLLTEMGGGGPGVWEYLENAAARLDSTDARAGISYFAGACGERGFFENLHEGNLTAGHLFRAALEAMVRNYEACAGRIAGAQPWSRIVFSGGLALRSDLLRRLILERFHLPHRLAPTGEDTLAGLLTLAQDYGRLSGPPAAPARDPARRRSRRRS